MRTPALGAIAGIGARVRLERIEWLFFEELIVPQKKFFVTNVPNYVKSK
jgi:hypothetical protein